MVENESCGSIGHSLLTRYLKFQRYVSSVHSFHKSFDHKRFHSVAPGNEIPEWYNHQSVGSLITVELHPGWFTNKWMGFAGCAVFGFIKPLSPGVEWTIRCSLTANGESWGHCGLIFRKKISQPMLLDHIWFFFMHPDTDTFTFKHEWQDIYYQLEFAFIPIMEDMEKVEAPQVKKCGVRVIYEEDVEELWQTLLKQSNPKRGLQQYDDDAASSSASQAHPKRIKQLLLDGAGPNGSPYIHDHKHG